MNAFLLEDEPRDSDRIIAMLGKGGFDVALAEDSEQAYQAFDLLAKTKELPEVGIFDIRIDKEYPHVTGLDIAKKLLRKYTMAILFLTDHYDDQEFSEKAKKLGVPTRYYLPKRHLDNPEMFVDTVYNAIQDFRKSSMSGAEYLARTQRKIGIHQRDGAYRFFGKDSIVYLKGINGDYCELYLSNGKKEVFSATVGTIGAQIGFNFLNFVRLNKSCWLNLEKVTAIEGSTVLLEHGMSISFSNKDKDGSSWWKKLEQEHFVIRTKNV